MPDNKTLQTMFGAPDTDTFMGIEACTSPVEVDAAMAVIGIPCATPYVSVGPYCAAAPRAIRETIAVDAGNRAHFDFDCGGPLFPDPAVKAVDCGDLDLDAADPAANRAAIRAAVSDLLDRKAVPVVLGGDDSVPIPMLDAYAGHGPITILQIDAHIDWRNEVGGERWGLSSTMRRASEMDHVSAIHQVGQRGVGSARPGDRQAAIDWGVHFTTARDLCRDGTEPVLDSIAPGSDIVICFDCDALDPSIMPGVIGRAPGGLTYWQAVDLIEGAARRGRVAGFNLVEFMPDRDVDGLGALTAGRVMATAMGVIARQSV